MAWSDAARAAALAARRAHAKTRKGGKGSLISNYKKGYGTIGVFGGGPLSLHRLKRVRTQTALHLRAIRKGVHKTSGYHKYYGVNKSAALYGRDAALLTATRNYLKQRGGK